MKDAPTIIEKKRGFVKQERDLYDEFCIKPRKPRRMSPDDFNATCALAVFRLGEHDKDKYYVDECMRNALLDLATLNDLSPGRIEAQTTYCNSRGECPDYGCPLDRQELIEQVPGIVRKRVIDGLTFTEIGNELGVTRRAASKLYKQALAEAKNSSYIQEHYSDYARAS